MGNTCKSMADSCQCMTKTTTILKSNQPPTNKNKQGKKKKSSQKSNATKVLSNLVQLQASLLEGKYLRLIYSMFFLMVWKKIGLVIGSTSKIQKQGKRDQHGIYMVLTGKSRCQPQIGTCHGRLPSTSTRIHVLLKLLISNTP